MCLCYSDSYSDHLLFNDNSPCFVKQENHLIHISFQIPFKTNSNASQIFNLLKHGQKNVHDLGNIPK